MKDYIKFMIPVINIKAFINNSQLYFTTHINPESGIECNCKIAYFKGLYISNISSSSLNHLYVEGNPRIYWQEISDCHLESQTIDIDIFLYSFTKELNIESSNDIILFELTLNSHINDAPSYPIKSSCERD